MMKLDPFLPWPPSGDEYKQNGTSDIEWCHWRPPYPLQSEKQSLRVGDCSFTLNLQERIIDQNQEEM